MVELKNEERTKCEIWSRVMGYHRPVSEYNPGKQAEHKERVFFREDRVIHDDGKREFLKHLAKRDRDEIYRSAKARSEEIQREVASDPSD